MPGQSILWVVGTSALLLAVSPPWLPAEALRLQRAAERSSQEHQTSHSTATDSLIAAWSVETNVNARRQMADTLDEFLHAETWFSRGLAVPHLPQILASLETLQHVPPASGLFAVAPELADLYQFRTIRNEYGQVTRATTTFLPASRWLLRTLTPLVLEFGPPPPEWERRQVRAPTQSWKAFLRAQHVQASEPIQSLGRTVVFPRVDGTFLVLKFARNWEEVSGLGDEGRALAYWSQHGNGYFSRFRHPIDVEGSPVVALTELPRELVQALDLGFDTLFTSRAQALATIATPDHLSLSGRLAYLNDSTALDETAFWVALLGEVGDLGRWVQRGFAHTVIIRRYHHRQERGPRDRGVSKWWWEAWDVGGIATGQEDRWWRGTFPIGRLPDGETTEAATDYPNLKTSGVDDLEHLAFRSTWAAEELFQEVGNSLDGCVELAASYYRNRNPQRGGWANRNDPATAVDARDLFPSKDVWAQRLRAIFQHYYHAVTGSDAAWLERVIDWGEIAAETLDAFGVDRYMISRRDDLGDQPIYDGPHLGLVNGVSPLQALLRAIHITSVAVVVDLANQLQTRAAPQLTSPNGSLPTAL